MLNRIALLAIAAPRRILALAGLVLLLAVSFLVTSKRPAPRHRGWCRMRAAE